MKNSSLFLLLFLALASASCGLVTSSHHDPELYTKAQAAAEAGDVPTMTTLIKNDPDVVKAKEWSSLTLLHLAVLHNQTNLVVLLLDDHSDVNAKSDQGVTPLHEAAQNGNQAIVELLLAHQADLNAVDAKGWTPLVRAQKWEHPEMVAFLRQKGGHE